jgi:hypothetical protein
LWLGREDYFASGALLVQEGDEFSEIRLGEF